MFIIGNAVLYRNIGLETMIAKKYKLMQPGPSTKHE